MRLLTAALLAVTLAALAATPQKKKPQTTLGAGAQKKKPARRRSAPPAVRVTPAAKAAALHNVEQRLAASTPGEFAQPGALVPLFELLYRASEAKEPLPVHLLHYGDSHTAADDWTGRLRELFQQRFGDGGSGFSLAGRPFLGYRRYDARGGATTLWRSEGHRSASGDGYLGLGGFSITAERTGQSVYLDTDCERLEVHYLQQPGGGSFTVSDAGTLLGRVETAGDLGPGVARFDVAPGERRRFEVRTLGREPVRLFGWVADRASGVTYEALGINGAEAPVILKWNQELLATYLQRRNPGLIVLAYGTNEASDPKWAAEGYEATLSTLLQALRAAAPAASILVLGPPDRMSRQQGAWRPHPGIDRVIAAQQNACRENRCAFWDARERMGGPGAIRDWVYAGLAQGDYVHFTTSGYRRMAEALFEDTMRQYDTYKKTRQEITGSANGQAK
jgi:lysophospholipase L1-like esterase